jgi:hypothetical protein
MKLKKIIPTSLCSFVLALFFTSTAWAQELSVNYSFVQSQADEYSTQGLMEVTVFNQTAGDLRNVDLRLEQPDSPDGSIENGVYQLGTIPNGERRVHSGNFQLPADFLNSEQALVFRVDYDDATGAHSQIIVFANQ